MICPKCFYAVTYEQDKDLEKCTLCNTPMCDQPDDFLLYNKGGIAKEVRPSQAELSNDIYELGLRYDESLFMAEAGTGIGKSFAYLIPSILRNKRVIVSTAKKNLQQQLVLKDIPFLTEAMNEHRSFSTFKGTKNYACYKLGRQIKNNHDREKFNDWVKRKIREKKPAELSDWDGKEPPWWDAVSAENCIHKTMCEHLDYCKPNPRGYNILVVNHSILAIDLFLTHASNGLLGDYDTLIIDEAHQAPEMFANALSASLTERLVNALYTNYTENTQLQGFCEHSRNITIQGLLEKNKRNFNTIKKELFNNSKNPKLIPTEKIKEITPVICDSVLNTKQLKTLFDEIEAALYQLPLEEERKLRSRLQGDATIFDELRYDMKKIGRQVTNLSRSYIRVLQTNEMYSCIPAHLLTDIGIVNNPETEMILTATKDTLKAQPVDMGPFINRAFAKIPHKILVSATLKIDGKFDHMQNVYGILNNDPAPKTTSPIPIVLKKTAQMFNTYESPFNYRDQARLYMPMYQEDGSLFPIPPSPSDPIEKREEWINAQVNVMQRLIISSRGDALILFSAKKDLLDITERFNYSFLESMGISIIKQEGDAAYALDQYRKTDSSVLCGLKSFWEGIDIVGSKLRLVIVPKIPFPAPDDPIYLTKAKKMEQRGEGRNIFNKLSVPKAVMDMRQASGRLIRSKTDYGVFAITDSRIWSKEKDPIKRKQILRQIENGKTGEERFPKNYGGRIILELGIPIRVKTLEEVDAFLNR